MAVQEVRSTSPDPHPDYIDQHDINSQQDIFLSECESDIGSEFDSKAESYFYLPGKKGDFVIDSSSLSTSQESKESNLDNEIFQLREENDILRKENELLKKENCILKEKLNILELNLKSNNNNNGNF